MKVLRSGLAIGVFCLAWVAQTKAALLVSSNSTWKYFKGRTEASSPDIAAWRNLNFADLAWPSGNAPFYYGENIARGTSLSDMQNNYTTLFLRQRFVVTNLNALTSLSLDAVVDDGFIAWVNGIEIAQSSGPSGDPLFNSVASVNAAEPVGFNVYSLPDPKTILVPGTNVLAVQVFNVGPSSSDLVFDAELTATEQEAIPPRVSHVFPPPGDVEILTEIVVTFSEPVIGVDAVDFLVNGAPATGVTRSGSVYRFTFPEPLPAEIQIAWNAMNGITDQAVPPNGFNPLVPSAGWTYNLVDRTSPVVVWITPPPGLRVRNLSQIEVQFSEPVIGVDPSDLLINGIPANNGVGVGAGPYIFQFPTVSSGAVTFSWAADHGITDSSTTENPFAGGTWQSTVDPQAQVGDLVINEFMAENASGLKDEDNDQEDWIEIYNQGATAVNLEGWSLTDESDEPGRWIFPAVILPARQYLVVFASGKDRKPTVTGSKPHTNFKLSLSGEYLGLFSPESPRQAVSAINPTFPEQRIDYTYGLDGAGQWRYFLPSTPCAPNGESTITNLLPPVHFSVERGFFQGPVNLSLSSETPGVTIRYTLNGSVPTETNGIVYTNFISITTTRIVRASVFKSNSLPSQVITHTYLYGLTSQRRLLPALSLVTATNNLFGRTGIMETNPRNTTKHGIAWERPVSAEFIRPQDNGGFQIDCGIRVQGGGYIRERYNYRTTALPEGKYSFRLYFRGDYGSGRLDYPLISNIPITSFDTIVLRAGMNDASNPFIRDELIRRLAGDTGQVASHGTFVNLFINGVYKGYYNPTERIDSSFLQSWHGGGEDWDVVAQFGELREGNMVEWNSLRSFIASKSPIIDANYQEIARRLDLVNFIDYLLPLIYGDTGDWPHNNWRAARERAPHGKYRFYVWDAEWAVGLNSSTSHNTFTEQLAGDSEIPRIYKRLRLSKEFRLLFADRVHKHFFNDGGLTDARIRSRYEELRANVSGTISGFNNSIGTSWIPGRRRFLLNHFNSAGLLGSSNAPVFNQFGGRIQRGFSLTMTSTNGAIYYTTNGIDPRVPFTGEVASDALAYSSQAPVRLNNDVVIKARTLANTNWSAVTEAAFQVEELGDPVRISEVMYNPPGGDAYEFIELQNVGAVAVNLSGMSFEGVNFRFPEGTPLLAAGASLVVISDVNPALFSQRYPGIIIAGRFGGSLANGGERLALTDRNGRTVISVDYDDEGAWPTAADGGGHSLEIIDLNGDPDDPANWRASAQIGGSPGAANPEVPSASVRLNEIMAENVSAVKNGEAYPDWIELHNGGDSTVSLAGWSLSDGTDPRKYVFPSGVNLPAGGYLVVWADDLTDAPGLHIGFALGRTGETVLLFDSQTNRVDAISFGLQLADSSIGRVGPGAGAWELTEPTPGGLNEVANLAPSTNLVINEFLANPAAGGEDWIELFNQNKDLPVALRGTYLSTSNALFQLRSLSLIPPGGFVQLFADENPGSDHLDFKLPAAGGIIVLSDQSGSEINRINYGTQPEGVSMGRLPDGSDNLVSFPSSASPAASNYLAAYSGPLLNEVLARNETLADPSGEIDAWIELYNPNSTAFDLSGMTLSVDADQPGQWSFPPGTTITPRGYLLLRGDGSRAASTKFETPLDLGRSLADESGAVYLFNPGGQVVDLIEYGFQLPDLSIGRSGNIWVLLANPTPAATNASPAALGNGANLRLNEWLANPIQGDDWFEIYNADSMPVHLGGLYLSDDPSLGGQTKFQIPQLSFVPGQGWVLYQASGQTGGGRNHVNFTLDEQGETLRIYSSSLALIDSIDFITQEPDASEGRLVDGGAIIVPLPNSPTPGEANFLPLTNVVINEALTHTDPPLEDAIELYNTSSEPADVGGWFLSNTPDNLKKFRIPDGTIITARGYKVFYEYQFNPDPGSPNSFTLNSAHGDDVNLSSADVLGNLTGYRSRQKFGAADNGVSFGRFRTSAGADFVAMSQRSFSVDNPATLSQFRAGTGKLNSYPGVGPVVINEIMYHPITIAGTNSTENTDEEFIELHNIIDAPVALFDPANPNNTWKLANAVDFVFPKNVTLGPGNFLLLVGFDPSSDTTTLAAFQAKYKIPPSVRIFGPYQGKLANDRDSVELFKPDPPQLPPHPDAGFVPYVLADRINYADVLPWPPQADGEGESLQRRQPTLYGNDPAAWRATEPNAGTANPVGPPDEDADGLPDEWEIANGLNPNDPADPERDPDDDELTNRQEFYAGTDPRDSESTLALEALIPAGTVQQKVLLRFGVVAGKTYTVEFQDDLGNRSWQKLATLEAQASTGEVGVIDNNPNTNGSRFYRLVTPKKP